jgi:hypothetical protein
LPTVRPAVSDGLAGRLGDHGFQIGGYDLQRVVSVVAEVVHLVQCGITSLMQLLQLAARQGWLVRAAWRRARQCSASTLMPTPCYLLAGIGQLSSGRAYYAVIAILPWQPYK